MAKSTGLPGFSARAIEGRLRWANNFELSVAEPLFCQHSVHSSSIRITWMLLLYASLLPSQILDICEMYYRRRGRSKFSISRIHQRQGEPSYYSTASAGIFTQKQASDDDRMLYCMHADANDR